MPDPQPWQDSATLYDAMAADYDSLFESPGYRRAYDRLAGAYIESLLPGSTSVIVDAGCGTGRWARRWIALGYDVIGIEQSPRMIDAVNRKVLGARFRLIPQSIDHADLTPGSVDAVVAMGSLQYLADPLSALRKFAGWLKPGGMVCIYTDSLVALVLELMRMGKTDEAIQRLKTRRGVFRQGETTAELHLYDSAALKADLRAVGLVDVVCRGLLISATAWEKARCAELAAADEEAFLQLERDLSGDPAMADAGKHIIASGRLPV